MSDEPASLADLPAFILLDIFSRLPPTTILHVKSVCKYFLDLTLEITHFSKHPSTIIIHQFHSWTTRGFYNIIKFLKSIDHEIRHDPKADLDLQLYFPIGSFSLIGSVHGFVCLNYFSNDADAIYILNPSTREYITLPEAEGVRKYPNLVNYGFAFDPLTLEYKVVRIYLEVTRDDANETCTFKSEGQVYTIGKGYWRSAGHVHYGFGCRLYGVNLHGKIHWLVSDANGNELICFLDLEKESFDSFPTAPGYSQVNCPNLRSLGVLGRCLCLCDNNAESELVVRVMKEYGVTSSWVKEIVISKDSGLSDRLCYEMIYLLKVLEDGEVLFLWRDDFLFLYHPEKKTLKMLDIFNGNFLASVHLSNSFSLKTFQREFVTEF